MEIFEEIEPSAADADVAETEPEMPSRERGATACVRARLVCALFRQLVLERARTARSSSQHLASTAPGREPGRA